MSLFVNQVLEFEDAEKSLRIERLLWVHGDPPMAYTIRIDRASALPESRAMDEMEAAVSAGRIKLLKFDPFACRQHPEDSIPAKHRRRRDAAWAIIEPIVASTNGAAFDAAQRGPLVREAVQRARCTPKRIYLLLRRYWQGGQTRNALLPHFDHCGGRGKDRTAGTKKRGRPRMQTKLNGAPPGINIGVEARELLKKGYRMFVEKTADKGGQNLRRGYEFTLSKFFHAGYRRDRGAIVPVLPEAHRLPSFEQFRYWGRKGIDLRESLVRRQGERRYNLRSRPILGDSSQMAFGPGSYFQIDSTVADVWLVSGLDRSRRLGRPTLYFVVDQFSHLIAGFHAGLENPSFFAAGLAIENAALEKTEFCKSLGFEIHPEEWPAEGIPEAIVADRGELEGYGATNLVHALGIQVSNTAPYRADLKGIAERTFRSMNDSLIHSLPGAVRKPKERGESDPRLDAALTLPEFRSLMIRAILEQNRRRIEGYRLLEPMIADGVEPRPIELWAWGIRNRTGHLRAANPDVLRVNLLPGDRGTVTPRGIRFRGLFYSCELAAAERWFERARSTSTWQLEVAYDPRLVDKVFLRHLSDRAIEPCSLVEADERFAGRTWPEVEDFNASQAEAREATRTDDLQSRSNFSAHVQSIVTTARDEAARTNRGLTKRARLGGVRENRRDAMLQEHQATSLPPPDERASGSPAVRSGGIGEHAADAAAEDQYVPPPSQIEILRRQREAAWRKP